MPAIDNITIKGFRSIRSIEDLELGAVNVLIGPNGSGKTNFIGALSFLQSLRGGRLQDYVRRAGGAEEIMHFGSSETDEINVHISFDDRVLEYEINLEATDTDTLYPFSEYVYHRDEDRPPGEAPYRSVISPRENEAGISNSDLVGIGSRIRRRLRGWRLYHFHDTGPRAPMKRASDVNNNRRLRPNGSNLAAFLYLLRKRHRDSYRMIRNTIRLAAPFFDDFILEPDELNEDRIRLEWTHNGGDDYFNAASLSDGTLRFMALTTLLLQPKRFRPSVILLDEPELGLHPHAITLLASLIHSISEETQLVLATQSPFLLDHFDPEEVLVAERVRGGTQLMRLDPQKLDAWLEEYSLGQLWEKNEFGGRPRRGAIGTRPPMTRILIHVEGQTEETFVNEVLGPHLYDHGYLSIGARLMGNARQRGRRGGVKPWRIVRRDVLEHLRRGLSPYCRLNG